MLISLVTEETRLYLFNAYELFSFNFVLLVIEKDVSHPNLTNPESTSVTIQSINQKSKHSKGLGCSEPQARVLDGGAL